MITGIFTAGREAILPVVLSAADGREVEIEAVIDTGFDGFLTLPANLIEDLGLSLLGRMGAALGDGSKLRMGGFEATVLWDGGKRNVLVLQLDGAPLVGTAMLLGHRLTVDAEVDGFVGIQPLPPRRAVPVV